MLERGEGRIINITSTAARTRDVSATSVPQLAYAASKAALDSFSFGLVQDLADTGVALNLLAPVVLTESVEYHLTDPRFDEVSTAWRMAHTARWWLGSPTSLSTSRSVPQNHDLEALGFLST
jgi:NAD(P)-dependent dehydrogenase (short-subunit alcohol dehydrogenase family)